jgi:uncharacterized membrane protein
MTPRKKEIVAPEAVEPIRDARNVSSVELVGGIFLIVAGVLPWWVLVWLFHKQLSEVITVSVLGLYVFVVFETFAVFFLTGLGRLSFPDKFLHWLGGATVGEVVGLLYYVIKHFGK